MKYIGLILRDKYLLVAAFFILLPSGFDLFLGQQGRIVVSSPLSIDPLFRQTVLYMVDHNLDGATAVVINRPYPSDRRKYLPAYIRDRSIPLYWGGPVSDTDEVLVMIWDENQDQSPDIRSPDVRLLKEWLKEKGNTLDGIESRPDKYRLYIGYAGWQALQFEMERLSGVWVLGGAWSKRWSDQGLDGVTMWKKILGESGFYHRSGIRNGIGA